ncbi:unnamed protein product [Dibothriocephalus latus]|uniref:Calponin-homology (CH) domain-containing protein n=1 Tax=Dibothriocephalus latus TaxID=60516 RepID=A0A3P7LCX0_DIBLA|nr:unnamed protein product [Dibothriocephalus latus]
MELDDEVLRELYTWVDAIPLSRPKKNIARDFSDGVLVAEVVKHFFPKYVDLHNFQTCNRVEAKRNNWLMLNWRIFNKFNFKLSDDVIDALINARPGTIEKLLLLLRSKINKQLEEVDPDTIDEEQFLHQKPSKMPISPVNIKLAGQNNNVQTLRTDDFRDAAQKILLQKNTKASRQLITPTYSSSKPTVSTKADSDDNLRLLYEQKVQECLALEETVEILNAKIKRMAHLLELKDIRINELQANLNY